MKRVILCADGTWNIRDQVDKVTKKRHPSNVTKVARAVRGHASVLQDSMTATYRVMGEYIRPICNKPADSEVLHKSVLDRRKLAECDYHPENLEAFLARGAPFDPAIATRVPTGTPCPPQS